MSLWLPPTPGFTWQVSNVDATRPAATFGTSVSFNASANIKGSFTQVLGAIANEALGIMISVNSVAVAAASGDCLIDIGIDPAGGTSYTVLIPNLLCSCAGTYAIGHGINYYFPLRIPAGATVAARGQRATAAGTFSIIVRLFGKPERPEVVNYGVAVDAFGVNTATSGGTAITSGTTAEGTYTQIGSATTVPYKWLQQGMGINDTTMTGSLVYALDLAFGDASNKVPAIQDQWFVEFDVNENLCSIGAMEGGSYHVPTGAIFYQRIQCSGTADSALSGAVYAVR